MPLLAPAFRPALMAGLLALAGCSAPPPAAPVRPALVVQAGAGSAGSVEAFAGEIHAREEPPLAFRVGGRITRRLVDAGSAVVAGQVLAELDAGDLALQSEARRAQLLAAESELALARAELARYQGLVDRQLVSRSLYDTRLASLRAAEARVRQARAEVGVAGNQVGHARLRAPSDGIIAQRLAEAGQVVAAGQPVFVLAAAGPREVLISIPEQSLPDFTPGRPLSIELWARPGQRFAGRLRELSAAADPQTRTYAARVALADASAPVSLGQSARVYLPASGAAALTVPLSALLQSGGKPAVWRVGRDGRVALTPVTIGPYREDGVPVLSGLRPSDWVVAAGAHLLVDGERVAPVDRDNRPVRPDAAPAAAAQR